MTHVLNKNNNAVCFVSNYSSIQFCIDADFDYFIVKEQRVRVFLFCVQ